MSRIDDVMAKLDYYQIQPKIRRDPTEADLVRFEQKLGGKLPPDYRVFLSRYGLTGLGAGGRFVISEPCPWGASGSVDQYFGFCSKSTQDIVYQTLDVYAGRIPDETIAIGSDAGGNLILLGFHDPVMDHVFFWDHEHREIDPKHLKQMVAELELGGVKVKQLDNDAIVWRWERHFPDRLTKPIGYSNVYRIANGFVDFLESLRPD
jgi:hypothetical protein